MEVKYLQVFAQSYIFNTCTCFYEKKCLQKSKIDTVCYRIDLPDLHALRRNANANESAARDPTRASPSTPFPTGLGLKKIIFALSLYSLWNNYRHYKEYQ